jgi:hypothetical protein
MNLNLKKWLNVKKWVNIKKWFNKYIISFLLLICFIFLLYNLFVKSYEGLATDSNSLSNIKTWYFRKSRRWYKIKRGVDVIDFDDIGFSSNTPEITITFLYNNLMGKGYWRNIFHFTNTDKNCCGVGDRVPAMWVLPDNTNNFHITVSTKNNENEYNGNEWFNTNNNIPFSTPVFIGIVVQHRAIKYYINNTLIMTKNYDYDIVKWSNETKLSKLYIGDKWHTQDDKSILIKDFTLYDAALTSDQINEVYSSMTDVNPPENNYTDNNGLSFTIYDGYFNDDMSFFKDADILYSGRSTNFTNIHTATEEYIVIDKDNVFSVVWKGYFLPDVSDEKWSFGLNSDDASYMWIGNDVTEYTIGNAKINNGRLHGMNLEKCNVSLSKGTYYPIQIVFGQNYGGADLQFFYTVDNSERKYDFNGKFFTEAIISTSTPAPTAAPTAAPASATTPSTSVTLQQSNSG